LVIDILTAFAKGVLYRESGVLNSHQSWGRFYRINCV